MDQCVRNRVKPTQDNFVVPSILVQHTRINRGKNALTSLPCCLRDSGINCPSLRLGEPPVLLRRRPGVADGISGWNDPGGGDRRDSSRASRCELSDMFLSEDVALHSIDCTYVEVVMMAVVVVAVAVNVRHRHVDSAAVQT